MTAHTYRSVQVPVAGGELHVGVWEPVGEITDTVLAVHGVTASHRAWPFVVNALPGVQVIAPDLRGRGRSNALPGPSSMRQHAADLVAVLDAFGIDDLVVMGHSMGAFVSLVLAHIAPERVRCLVLIDGGLPLDVPAGLTAEEIVTHILGPTAERLTMRFASTGEYLDFWREHPAFRDAWTPELESYFAYDLVADAGALRPATSVQTTTDDTVDLNTGSSISDALAALGHDTLFISVPRGLRDEEPGLYEADRVAGLVAAHPLIRHERLADLNHYTVTMSERGAVALAPHVRDALAGTAARPVE